MGKFWVAWILVMVGLSSAFIAGQATDLKGKALVVVFAVVIASFGAMGAFFEGQDNPSIEFSED